MDEEAIVKETLEVVEDIRTWVRALVFPVLRKLLLETLDTEQDKAIYSLSDGEQSSRQIAKKVDASHTTIVNLWKEWLKVGIVKESETPGRFRKIISLGSMGLK